MRVEWGATHCHTRDTLCTAHNSRYMCARLTCWVFFPDFKAELVSALPKSAKFRSLLELLQNEPWLRKLFDYYFCGMSDFLSLLPGFPERKEEFSPVILQNPCESLGACSGWCEPLGMLQGVVMLCTQMGGTCADQGCPCDFLTAQLWLYCLLSPLTLGWVQREMSDLGGLSCPSSTTFSERLAPGISIAVPSIPLFC